LTRVCLTANRASPTSSATASGPHTQRSNQPAGLPARFGASHRDSDRGGRPGRSLVLGGTLAVADHLPGIVIDEGLGVRGGHAQAHRGQDGAQHEQPCQARPPARDGPWHALVLPAWGIHACFLRSVPWARVRVAAGQPVAGSPGLPPKQSARPSHPGGATNRVATLWRDRGARSGARSGPWEQNLLVEVPFGRQGDASRARQNVDRVVDQAIHAAFLSHRSPGRCRLARAHRQPLGHRQVRAASHALWVSWLVGQVPLVVGDWDRRAENGEHLGGPPGCGCWSR
jgi:hypothetical protein